jgi:hypothetical protein
MTRPRCCWTWRSRLHSVVTALLTSRWCAPNLPCSARLPRTRRCRLVGPNHPTWHRLWHRPYGNTRTESIIPATGGAWSADKVVRVLADTQALARERAIALEQVPLVGRLLPAIYVQDWSLQGEPVLDTQFLLTTSHMQAALLTHVVEKD